MSFRAPERAPTCRSLELLHNKKKKKIKQGPSRDLARVCVCVCLGVSPITVSVWAYKAFYEPTQRPPRFPDASHALDLDFGEPKSNFPSSGRVFPSEIFHCPPGPLCSWTFFFRFWFYCQLTNFLGRLLMLSEPRKAGAKRSLKMPRQLSQMSISAGYLYLYPHPVSRIRAVGHWQSPKMEWNLYILTYLKCLQLTLEPLRRPARNREQAGVQ